VGRHLRRSRLGRTGEINIAHEVADRHATNREKVALYQVDTDGELTKMTFWELADRSSQFANVLEDLGVEQGDRVFSYMPRIPEHYVALVGTLKRGAPSGEASTSASVRTASPTDSMTVKRTSS